MKITLKISILIIVCFVGCRDKPAYEMEDWTESQYQPESIELSKAELNGNPIILSKKDLLELYGNPIQIIDSCSKIPIRIRQGLVTYDCWIYDSTWNMVYQIDGDTAFLSNFNFEKTNLEIQTPQIVLSKRTRFREIKNIFPNAYAHRNIGASIYRHEGYEWVHLIDDMPSDLKPFPSAIELRFKGGKLKHLEYQWQPKYTVEQLSNYHQQKKEIEQQTK